MPATVSNIIVERRLRRATRDMLAEQECNGYLRMPPAEQAQVWQGSDSDQVEKNERAGEILTLLFVGLAFFGIGFSYGQLIAMLVLA
jgi:hypothetical protein